METSEVTLTLFLSNGSETYHIPAGAAFHYEQVDTCSKSPIDGLNSVTTKRDSTQNPIPKDFQSG